ncbi:MAG TPA: tetratricopeptide repeat protein [Acidobacteriota bacterium]|nr:tetratricopeptide repeat protein [Acidobacteriota bacterium]
MDRNLAIKKKAQTLIQKGQIDAALAEFDKLFASGDKDPYDFILVADLLAKRGSMQEAVRRYRQAVDEYGRAELFKNAIAVCKKILRISKEDLQIHRTLGDLYAKEGLYGDAQLHYLEYAEGSIRRQEHDAALSALDLVLSLSPDNEELSEKYVEIATRADQPERGGKELVRRAERAEQAGRSSSARELRDRANTLAPSIAPESDGDAAYSDRHGAPVAGDDDLGIVRGVGDESVASHRGPAEPSANGYPPPAPTHRSHRGSFIEPGVVSLERPPADEAEPDGPSYEPAAERAPDGPSFASHAADVEDPPEPMVVRAAPEPPSEPRPERAPPDAAVVPPRSAAPVAPPEPVAPAAPAEPVPPTHEEQAASYLRSGDKASAVEEYWKAAELAFYRGDVASARAHLGSLLQIAPQHEAALRRRVDITAQSDDRQAEAGARFDLAELYLTQEEWALARAEYLRVLELDHDNDRARGRVQRLDAMMHGAAAAAPGVDFDSIDVPKPAASVRVRDESPINSDGLIDLEEIIDEFKQGVQNSISGEDHESHYDLGMAYMEMGLHDEAISEFRIAQKGGPMELKCLEMIALCFLEKNEAGEAVRELTRALELPGHGPDETISIRYNLGMAHERLGNLDRALQHFEEVHLLDVDFLHVAAKVRELKQRLSGSRDRA